LAKVFSTAKDFAEILREREIVRSLFVFKARYLAVFGEFSGGTKIAKDESQSSRKNLRTAKFIIAPKVISKHFSRRRKTKGKNKDKKREGVENPFDAELS